LKVRELMVLLKVMPK